MDDHHPEGCEARLSARGIGTADGIAGAARRAQSEVNRQTCSSTRCRPVARRSRTESWHCWHSPPSPSGRPDPPPASWPAASPTPAGAFPRSWAPPSASLIPPTFVLTAGPVTYAPVMRGIGRFRAPRYYPEKPKSRPRCQRGRHHLTTHRGVILLISSETALEVRFNGGRPSVRPRRMVS